MLKKTYKGKITKVKLEKNPEVCRFYSDLQQKYAEKLVADDSVESFKVNVYLTGNADEYTSDFMITKIDGSLAVRECVDEAKVLKPKTLKELEMSRRYWVSRNVDWGIVVGVKDENK